ncbi:MAG: TPM domain-containing protein [Dehalococcoidia bacterium]|nr:TPM domain-containing protein [Dehalococcoidia bacterium]
MKRAFSAFALVCVLLGLTASIAIGKTNYPAPKGWVSDYAGVLSADAVSRLTDRLSTLEKDTSAEVAVVTVDTLDNNSIEEYAAGLFQFWGIGEKDKDNGVLFIVAPNTSDIRIEVGYGLEPIITDGRAGRILDNEVIPYFKRGDYDKGIEAGVLAIEGYVRDGTPPSIAEENPVQGVLSSFKLPLYIPIILGVISVYMLGFMARTKSIWLGGIWGVILGLVLGFGFGGLLWIILLPLGLGILGLGFDAVLSSNYRGLSGSGQSTGWFSSGGGFRGSGGGFGGFGGGSSGGGGASRKW